MTIERKMHFDPEESWESLKTWIAGAAKDPAGEPVTEPIAKIMAVGAYIGLRFGLVSEQFALAVAEYGNAQDGHPIFQPLKEAFARDYVAWLGEQMENHFHNIGFTDIGTKMLNGDGTPVEQPAAEAPPAQAPEPVSEDDAKEIVDGLDAFFRGLREGGV